MTFPTKDGQGWILSPMVLEVWADVYAGLDVEQELRKASLWLDANPSRRKTARGMKRFLICWLNRAQRDRQRQRTRAQAPEAGHLPDRIRQRQDAERQSFSDRRRRAEAMLAAMTPDERARHERAARESLREFADAPTTAFEKMVANAMIHTLIREMVR